MAADALGLIDLDTTSRNKSNDSSSLPDIDLIVPKAELPKARELRKKHDGRSTPVKIGLAIPSTQIDYRPDDTLSNLELGKRIKVKIPTVVFQPVIAEFHGIPMKTASPELLRHVYGHLATVDTVNATKNQTKFSLINKQLGNDTHVPDDGLESFHQYSYLAGGFTPISNRSAEMFDALTVNFPPEMRDRLKRIALGLAGAAGWR